MRNLIIMLLGTRKPRRIEKENKKKKKRKGKTGARKKGKKMKKKKKKKKMAVVANVVALLPRPGEKKNNLDQTDTVENNPDLGIFQPTVSRGDLDAFLEALTETLSDVRKYLSKPAKSKKNKNRLDVLHDVPLFAECMEDPEVQRALGTIIIHRTYENNEVIMTEEKRLIVSGLSWAEEMVYMRK